MKGGHRMDVRLVCKTGVEHYEPEDLPRLLERDEAVGWVDIPVCDPRASQMLRNSSASTGSRSATAPSATMFPRSTSTPTTLSSS